MDSVIPIATPKEKKKYHYTMKTGRPTDYRPEYCVVLLSYFNIAPWQVKEYDFQTKDGETKTKTEFEPVDLPLIIDFCMKIGISTQCFHEWVKKWPDFGDAYRKCKALQEKILIQNGLRGFYDSRFASLAAKNMIGWRDKVENEVLGKVEYVVRLPMKKKIGERVDI